MSFQVKLPSQILVDARQIKKLKDIIHVKFLTKINARMTLIVSEF